MMTIDVTHAKASLSTTANGAQLISVTGIIFPGDGPLQGEGDMWGTAVRRMWTIRRGTRKGERGWTEWERVGPLWHPMTEEDRQALDALASSLCVVF